MARYLRRLGHVVGRKRVRRLMAKMGLEPIYQRPRTTGMQSAVDIARAKAKAPEIDVARYEPA